MENLKEKLAQHERLLSAWINVIRQQFVSHY